MELLTSGIEKAFHWMELQNGEGFLNSEEHCPTRDIFQIRLDRMSKEMENFSAIRQKYSLLTAITGELGNNSFDHNLGNWRDEKGIYFINNFSERFILVADRGQGVLTTLKGVRPKLKTESEAIRLAFTERISGRAPEQRGNGLKFVEKVVRENNWKIHFYSGNSMFIINDGLVEGDKKKNLKGVLAVIYF
ncbi:MAG: hypothetical protein HYT97_05155 [Elusimicrobia bacterium]|nr:hypothetical protein [Elusimicrobiota bacterium]